MGRIQMHTRVRERNTAEASSRFEQPRILLNGEGGTKTKAVETSLFGKELFRLERVFAAVTLKR